MQPPPHDSAEEMEPNDLSTDLFGPSRSPLDLLTVDEVKDYLGFRKRQSVYDISEHDLPRRKVGSSRYNTRFLWIDVVRYALGLPPVDVGRFLDEKLERALRPVQAARVHPAPGVAPKRERLV